MIMSPESRIEACAHVDKNNVRPRTDNKCFILMLFFLNNKHYFKVSYLPR